MAWSEGVHEDASPWKIDKCDIVEAVLCAWMMYGLQIRMFEQRPGLAAFWGSETSLVRG